MNKDKFLKEQKILRLATIDQNGFPHIVPVWYKYTSGKFYIGTNTRTKKAKNLKKKKKVSFCVDSGIRSPNIFGVMGNASARLILDKTQVLTIAKKILLGYFKTLENKSAQELLNDTNCIIEIIPKEYTVWKY